MKTGKLLTVILAAALIFTCFAGCAPQTPPASSSDQSSAPASGARSSSSVESSSAAETAWSPTGTITVICPYGAGGGQDICARVFAKHAEKYVGQKIIVDNRTGGSGAIGNTAIATAKPDGYTLGIFHNLSFFDPLLVDGVTYDHDSFIQLANICGDTVVVCANKSLGVSTLPELVEKAKENPGSIIWGGPEFSAQTYPRMYVEAATGASFAKMIFDGGAATLTAVMGGNCDMTSVFPSEYTPAEGNDDVVKICTMGDERIASMPDIPTAKEQGIDATFFQLRSYVAPAGTPDEIVDFYIDAFQKTLEDPDFQKELADSGFNYLPMSGPEAYERMMQIYDDSKDQILAALEASARN